MSFINKYLYQLDFQYCVYEMRLLTITRVTHVVFKACLYYT